MNTNQDERETIETLAPPTDREPPTRTDNPLPRSAIAPPAMTPDTTELADTALASTEPPEWFNASFIGQALTKFADDARAIRTGREAHHTEVMAAIGAQGTTLKKVTEDMAQLALELNSNLELLSGEFRRHRDASDARDTAQDGRIHQIEQKLGSIKNDVLHALLQAMPDAMQTIMAPFVGRIEALEAELISLRTNDPGTTQAPPAS